MSTNRLIRAVAMTPVVLVLMLLAGTGASAQNGCVLNVQPSSGTVGTQFTATGTGFGDPVVVTVLRNGTQVSERRTSPAGATGRFTVRFTATAAGTWLVRAVTPETECGDEVRVTVLADSATDQADANTRPDQGIIILAVLAAAAALGLRLGFGAGRRAGDRETGG